MSLGVLRTVRMCVPSAITALNMGFGLLAIACCMGTMELFFNSRESAQVAACWFIVCAAAFDAMDGKIARFLGASSKFGIQFDSLADVISFGVAPAVLLISLREVFSWPLFLVSFIFLVAGAARLARFNVQTKGFDKKNFTGLPIPMGATAVVTCLIFSEHVWGSHVWNSLWFFNSFLLLTFLSTLLMVSTVEYDTFPKFTLRTLKSKLLLGLFIACIILLVRYPGLLFFVFTWVYIMFGIVRWLVQLARRPQADEDEVPAEQPVSYGD